MAVTITERIRRLLTLFAQYDSMSAQALPQIPPRPTRMQDKTPATSAGENLLADIPKIPPRPINRRMERSQSPHRESFAPSPFNEIPPELERKKKSSTLYSSASGNPSTSDLPHRPASVILPSIGQEGSEYAEAFEVPDTISSPETQSRSIANDLKLHAPKPSLPQSSAKQRISTVTRTDSDQAAALGYGRERAGSDHLIAGSHSLKSKSSFTSQSSSHDVERGATSSHDQDESIPEIGLRVPMYRDAGDVQAPSPNPSAAIYAPGIGYHNDGSQKSRHHGRRLSGKGFDLPPGSYGLHGHGVLPHDKFEKAYYEKHPELLKKECGQYGGAIGDGRGEFVLSSEDLNKLVRETANRGSSLGTSSSAIGTPSEQVGFQASDEYISRISSPRPQSVYHNQAPSNSSEPALESSLRAEHSASLAQSLDGPSDAALESEVEEENIIHVDEPSRTHKIYGGDKHAESAEDLGPNNGKQAVYTAEHGYSAPILASDEVAKEPFYQRDMHPAVSPKRGNRDESVSHHRSGSGSGSGSHPSSRPSSMHGVISGMRDLHSTPLEDLHEYEPLFPEDEKSKPENAADRLKQPESKNRKFPSQDIWEDTPNSLQYVATVSTLQALEEPEEGSVTKNIPTRGNETPAQAFARRQEELAERESSDAESYLNTEKKPLAKVNSSPAHVARPARPCLKQRFPSRDIWEDTPDSLQLQTTVSGPQSDADVFSTPEERPTTGAVVYHQEKSAAGFALGEDEGRATTGIAAVMRPEIPARPTRQNTAGPSEDGGKVSQPTVPERPAPKRNIIPPAFAPKPNVPEKSKPSIPARPSRFVREASMDTSTRVSSFGSSKSQGNESEETASLAASKPKPPVPSRTTGSKIAALQGGFLSDLNKRLQLGPMAPKREESKPSEEEEEVIQEKAPLADARKGRARGPARRAPAKSAASAPVVIVTPLPEAVAEKLSSLGFALPSVQWSINTQDGNFTIIPQLKKAPEIETEKAVNASASTSTTSSPLGNARGADAAQAEKSVPAPSLDEGAQTEGLAQEASAGTSAEDVTKPETSLKSSGNPRAGSRTESQLEEENCDEMVTSTGTLKPLTESKEVSRPDDHDGKPTPSTSDESKTEHNVSQEAEAPEEK